jgi:6,7-dimethyl-8-ribityllumazine synthase
MTTFEGKLRGKGRRFGVVVSRTNDFVTRKLLDGAVAALRRHGVAEDAIEVLWVPGAFELGPAAARLLRARALDGVVCCGAVIRGDTDHYEWICHAATVGVEAAARESGRPVTFGVITAVHAAFAEERAGGAHGNLGAKAAEAALELADAYAAMDGAAAPSGTA